MTLGYRVEVRSRCGLLLCGFHPAFFPPGTGTSSISMFAWPPADFLLEAEVN